MDTKLKKLLTGVLPPIAFFALFSLRFVVIAKATLYPDFSSEIFSVLLFGALPSIVYLVSLALYIKSAKKSVNKVCLCNICRNNCSSFVLLRLHITGLQ